MLTRFHSFNFPSRRVLGFALLALLIAVAVGVAVTPAWRKPRIGRADGLQVLSLPVDTFGFSSTEASVAPGRVRIIFQNRTGFKDRPLLVLVSSADRSVVLEQEIAPRGTASVETLLTEGEYVVTSPQFADRRVTLHVTS